MIVLKSKTEAGTGCSIPLSQRACVILTMWLARFLGAVPDTYVFPHHKVGIAGDSRTPQIWDVDSEPSNGRVEKSLSQRLSVGESTLSLA